ncbi:T9SS type A sorting domain-containing protein [bacterium]|nr:T9SS type A sorting domain-containing protein [bacterium]
MNRIILFILLFLFAFGLVFAQDTLADSLNMRLVSTWDAGVTIGGGTRSRFAVWGNYVYVNVSGTLKVIDIEEPSSPCIVNILPDAMNAGNRIYFGGEYLYSGPPSSSSHDFKIIDISIPTSPVIIGSLAVGGKFYTVDDNSGYAIIKRTAKSGEVYFINISEPDSPFIEAEVPFGTFPGITGFSANCASLSDNLLHFVGSKGDTAWYYCYDISEPSTPVFIRDEEIVHAWTTTSTCIDAISDTVYAGYVVYDTPYPYLGKIWTYPGDCDFPYLISHPEYVDIYGEYLGVSEVDIVAIYHRVNPTTLDLLGYYKDNGGKILLCEIGDSLYLIKAYDTEIKIFKLINDTVGIEEHGSLTPEDRIKIYPNPIFNGKFCYTDGEAEIYDICGKRVKTISRTQKIVDTSNMSPGIYLVVPRESNRKPQKLLIMN